jgi:hypothetical protein
MHTVPEREEMGLEETFRYEEQAKWVRGFHVDGVRHLAGPRTLY